MFHLLSLLIFCFTKSEVPQLELYIFSKPGLETLMLENARSFCLESSPKVLEGCKQNSKFSGFLRQ